MDRKTLFLLVVLSVALLRWASAASVTIPISDCKFYSSGQFFILQSALNVTAEIHNDTEDSVSVSAISLPAGLIQSPYVSTSSAQVSPSVVISPNSVATVSGIASVSYRMKSGIGFAAPGEVGEYLSSYYLGYDDDTTPPVNTIYFQRSSSNAAGVDLIFSGKMSDAVNHAATPHDVGTVVLYMSGVVPPPPPKQVSGDFGDYSGFSEIEFGMYFDSDGDGTFDLLVEKLMYDLLRGTTMTWETDPGDNGWEIRAIRGRIDGNWIQLDEPVAGGVGEKTDVTTSSMSFSQSPTSAIFSSSVASDGTVQQSTFGSGELVNAAGQTNNVYYHTNNEGQTTTIVMSGDGSEPTTRSDVYLQMAEAAIDSASIVSAIKSASDKSAGHLAQGFDPAAFVQSMAAPAAGWDVAPQKLSPSVTVPSDSSIWNIPIGNQTINANPFQFGWFNSIAGFARDVIVWIITVWLNFALWRMIWELVTELHKVPQTKSYPLNIEVEVLGVGGGLNAFGFFVGRLLAAAIVTAIATALTTLSTFAEVTPGTFPALFDAAGSLFSGGTGATAEGIHLIDAFFPIRHAFIAAGNYALCVMFRQQIYVALAAARKMIVG